MSQTPGVQNSQCALQFVHSTMSTLVFCECFPMCVTEMFLYPEISALFWLFLWVVRCWNGHKQQCDREEWDPKGVWRPWGYRILCHVTAEWWESNFSELPVSCFQHFWSRKNLTLDRIWPQGCTSAFVPTLPLQPVDKTSHLSSFIFIL